jgi:altronate dehydratase large subunit
MSGVTANPMTGVAADWLVARGGRVLLSETTEMIGTENLLAARAAGPEVAARVVALVTGQEKRARDLLGPLADLAISPGNAEGGLTNIREKSLGCIVKGGTSPIRSVVEYGETPREPGLSLMDGPGSDVFSMTGLAAAGAQVMVFTTGRGTPAGFPILPVVKVATNSALFARMAEDMDLDAGTILAGVPIAAAGRELIDLIARVASGEPTKAEINGQDLVAIHTLEPAF